MVGGFVGSQSYYISSLTQRNQTRMASTPDVPKGLIPGKAPFFSRSTLFHTIAHI
jgi:hypothetical protein